jgi:hypothetical protein
MTAWNLYRPRRDFASSRAWTSCQRSTVYCHWYIYFLAIKTISFADITVLYPYRCHHSTKSPYWPKPWWYVHISTPLHLCWFPIVPLSPFGGKVAAVVGDFCKTPNQIRISLPLMHLTELKLRADVCYGSDDPTLWSQPWSICTFTWVPLHRLYFLYWNIYWAGDLAAI